MLFINLRQDLWLELNTPTLEMEFMHMIDLCLMKILEVDLLALPSSSFFLLSSSFLLAYSLLFFLFRHDFRFLGVHGVCWPRAYERKRENGFCFVFQLCLQYSFSLSFSLLWPNICQVGEKNCVLFIFSFCSLDSIFKITLIANLSPIKSCLLVLPKPCV